MSYTNSKKVIIYRKAEGTEFSKKNAGVLPSGANKIGASINAVNKIMIHSDMLGEIMPSIIGMSKSESEFTRKVNNYWNSIAVNVPEPGKSLEVGFVYSLKDSAKLKATSNINGADGKPKSFTTDQQLAEYVESHISEEDRWLYGNPINASDYLLWRYCLNYKAVSNSPDEKIVGKSSDIRFYIHNEELIKKQEKSKFETRNKAGKVYFEVVAKPELVKMYLYAMGDGAGIETMDELDRSKLLEKIYNERPNDLILANKDKQLDLKAYIEECISAGILRRLQNTDVIVNSTDNEPIGNNMTDAIAFLKAESNAKIANDIKGRLRALPK